jgi:hypothetical protein
MILCPSSSSSLDPPFRQQERNPIRTTVKAANSAHKLSSANKHRVKEMLRRKNAYMGLLVTWQASQKGSLKEEAGQLDH